MAAKPGPLRPHEERPNYARREPTTPPPGEPALGDSFLIVTEGEVTERMYFEAVRALLQVNPVTIRVVHPHCTDAEGLVREAMKERDDAKERRRRAVAGNRDVAAYDHVWVVCDTDVAARQGQLKPALALARAEGIYVAHTTPCMEFWLLLHFHYTTAPLANSEAAENALSDAWGQRYDKRAETFPALWDILKGNIPAASSRAVQVREHHQAASTEFPANPSTDVDQLVRALDASVQPPFRVLR